MVTLMLDRFGLRLGHISWEERASDGLETLRKEVEQASRYTRWLRDDEL
jgi:hypothetical protein